MGKLKSVFLKNIYCTEKMVRGYHQCIPIEPQPKEAAIIRCHCYFAKSEGKYQLQERVTIFTKFSFKEEYKQKIALVEYQGERNSERMESGKNEATKNK